jgi:hypothetical protein
MTLLVVKASEEKISGKIFQFLSWLRNKNKIAVKNRIQLEVLKLLIINLG